MDIGRAQTIMASMDQMDAMQYVDMDTTGIVRLLYVRNPDKLKIR